MNMNTKTVTLDKAIEAARKLPQEAQEALAKELLERVEEFSAPERSPERQVVIKDRLSRPLKEVSLDDLMAMLRQYNPAL
jgi:hypothetical protein